eukprot:6091882-Pleurochrysis_carterae.AAC.1
MHSTTPATSIQAARPKPAVAAVGTSTQTAALANTPDAAPKTAKPAVVTSTKPSSSSPRPAAAAAAVA